jgi:hypothetical protein
MTFVTELKITIIQALVTLVTVATVVTSVTKVPIHRFSCKVLIIFIDFEFP